MGKALIMGNEAIALGAMAAGVSVVTGYPGTPSTEVLESVVRHNDGSIYVEWSVNEKVALEVAAGAAYAGLRAMVTMKQVGLNVASDALMSLNYVGVKGGLVLVVADDPGPISSQTEQDTRHFGQFAKVAVFDPASPEEAYTMVQDAFALSEKYQLPVILRPTTRVCHSCAAIEAAPVNHALQKTAAFEKGERWVIFPKLAYENHKAIEEKLLSMSAEFSGYRGNSLRGQGKLGIATGGVSHGYVEEALTLIEPGEYKLLKVGTIPFPKDLAVEFLSGLEKVLVIEELDPVIENELIALCGRHRIPCEILGKVTGHMPKAGENTVTLAKGALEAYFGIPAKNEARYAPDGLSQVPRPPVLCAGCPHRASFFAVKEATKGRKAVYSGDIGCYTLGNAAPLHMVDTCLCMGGGITIAQGLEAAEPDTLHFAFVGDSTFFHSGITGIINAVYNRHDIILVVLDNATTAMTGNQYHPGIGKTAMGQETYKMSIEAVLRGIGVSQVITANPFDGKAAREAVSHMLPLSGVRAIIFEAPCIAVSKPKEPMAVGDGCVGCKACINKLGCPAISMKGKKAYIDPSLCTGCGICREVCPVGAIGEVHHG